MIYALFITYNDIGTKKRSNIKMKLESYIQFRYNDYRIKDRRASNDRKRQAGRTADEARVGEAGVL
jgi:hypothetical protein